MVGYPANLLDAFINEVSILSQLEHKHIVHVKDFEINGLAQKHNGKCSRVVYYTMTLAATGDLLRLIEETDAFSEKLARYYFRQLIEGIGFLTKESNSCTSRGSLTGM